MSDLAAILDDLDATFARYVAFPSDSHRHAVTVWTAHTWVVDAFDSTPRLAVLSPEKGSGKTRVLEVIELHVPGAMFTVNVSSAAMFRVVASDDATTMLLDEADTYLGLRVAKEHEDIRGLVNAGHRRGAKAMRAVVAGANVRVEEYPCFAPVALAGIGDLPDTIMDRSVIVPMRRRTTSEHVEPFRFRRAERDADHLAGRLEEWAGWAVQRLEDREPEMPTGITDRPADVWEPLVIIGDEAGEVWSQRIRDAAMQLNAERAQRDPSLGIQLLADIRTVFSDRDRMTTEDLIEALVDLESAPWGDLRGKPIDARGIARRVRKYDVRPGDHRFGDATKKGYLREDFYDAWQRYLPAPDDDATSDVADVADVAHTRGERGDGERPSVAPVEAKGGGEIYSFSGSVTQSGQAPFPAPSAENGQQGQHEQSGDTCPGCGGPPGSFSVLCANCTSDAPESRPFDDSEVTA